VAAAPSRGSLAAAGRRRTIYDTRGTQRLPGTVVRREGEGSSKDPAVNEAYNGLGGTYDFYAAVFGRDSIDDAGLPLDATVHFGRGYDNAFWNGEQMVFGDGDGEYFNRFTRPAPRAAGARAPTPAAPPGGGPPAAPTPPPRPDGRRPARRSRPAGGPEAPRARRRRPPPRPPRASRPPPDAPSSSRSAGGHCSPVG